MSRPYLLHTLGTIALTAPDGSVVALDEPGVVALLVLLAVGGDAGVGDDDLLLRLTPSATAEQGRAEIARLVGVARKCLGNESTIARMARGYALTPGSLALDVRMLDASETLAETNAEFLEGFKLPGSPEFREWLEETRRRVAPAIRDTSSRSRWRSRGGMIAGLAAVVVISGGLYLARPRTSSAFAAGDPLLVADIKNETGDSLYAAGMMSAATVGLQQSGRLRLYPRARVAGVYRLMQIANPDTALTFELAKEVAQRDGTVRFVLGLEIARAGDGFRVTGRVADASGIEAPAEFVANAKSKAEVIGALDDVLIAVRSHLGESRREMNGRRIALPYVTTSSLEALRSYGEGATAWSKGEYRLANELWHRAVDLDTGFAMAYGALGRSYYFNHDRQRGEQYFAEALARASRLTEGERLRLQESVADYRGQLDSSVIYSAQLAERFPSVSTWYNYGTSLMTLRRFPESVVAFQKALAFDPKHIASYINLATVAKAEKRYDDALGFYARAASLDSVVLYRDGRNNEWGSVFVTLGRYAEAESTFARMTRAPRIDARALALRSLGFLAAWQGRADDAIDFFRQATDAAVQLKSPLGELRDRLLLAGAYRTAGREREANAEVDKSLVIVAAHPIEPTALALVATTCVTFGRAADARAVLARIRTQVRATDAKDVGAEAYTAGLVALAANRPDSALHHVRAAGGYSMHLQRLALEAEAYRRLGQVDSAKAVVARLRNEPGFGYEGQDGWIHAPIVLGDLLLAARDTGAAIKAYQSFLDQWRAAPATLPDMIATRERLAALRAAAR